MKVLVHEREHSLLVHGVVFLELIENSTFNLTGFAVFLNRSDNLDGHFPPGNHMSSLNNFAKSALPEEPNDLVYEVLVSCEHFGAIKRLTIVSDDVIRLDYVVTLDIVPWCCANYRRCCCRKSGRPGLLSHLGSLEGSGSLPRQPLSTTERLTPDVLPLAFLMLPTSLAVSILRFFVLPAALTVVLTLTAL